MDTDDRGASDKCSTEAALKGMAPARKHNSQPPTFQLTIPVCETLVSTHSFDNGAPTCLWRSERTREHTFLTLHSLGKVVAVESCKA